MTGHQRRRGPYPNPLAIGGDDDLPPVGEHDHRQPRWPTIALSALVLVLTVAVIVLALYVADFAAFVDGRGEYRDAEAVDERSVRDAVRDAVCDVLDVLPPDERLDPIRGRYGCGPGAPRP